MSIRRSYLLILLSSLLLFCAAPGRWSIAALSWLALIPLLAAVDNQPPGRAAAMGFSCGLIYYSGLIYWITNALHNYGGLALTPALLVMLLLAAYMALYMALFAALLSWLKGPLWLRAPLIWTALDFIKARFLTGFPWQDLGYSQYQHPLLIQLADLGGHYLITFIIVMVNAALAAVLLKKSTASQGRRGLIPLIIILAAGGYNLWSYSHWQGLIKKAETVRIGIVQGNIDQAEKWQPGLQQKTVATYLRLSQDLERQNIPSIILWPETALPFFPLRNPLFAEVLSQVRAHKPLTLITGAPHVETGRGPARYYNSAFAIQAAGDGIRLQRYDKEHLVPFGEYVPFQKILTILPIVQGMGNFSAGRNQKPLQCGPARCGILICFESIFPALADQWCRLGADILINLTNDAWYGRSSAPKQQLSMVVLRAVENRRSLARAANTGISAFIDPLGRIKEASPIFQEYKMAADLPLIHQKSFYTRWGYLFAPLCLLILSLMILYGIYEKLRYSKGKNAGRPGKNKKSSSKALHPPQIEGT